MKSSNHSGLVLAYAWIFFLHQRITSRFKSNILPHFSKWEVWNRENFLANCQGQSVLNMQVSDELLLIPFYNNEDGCMDSFSQIWAFSLHEQLLIKIFGGTRKWRNAQKIHVLPEIPTDHLKMVQNLLTENLNNVIIF